MIAVNLLLLPLLLGDGAAVGQELPNLDHVHEAVDFLLAREQVWKDRFPTTVRFREWDETLIGPVLWEGVRRRPHPDTGGGAQLYVEGTRYEPGTSQEAARHLAGSRKVVLVSSGERWMKVQEDLPGDGEVGQSWTGFQQDQLPAGDWAESLMTQMHSPLGERGLVDFLEAGLPIDVHENDDKIVVFLASAKELAGFILAGDSSKISGFLGSVVTFERKADWRPTLMQLVSTYERVADDRGLAEVERIKFGGLDGAVYASYSWGGWVPLGEVMIPTSKTYKLECLIEGAKLTPKDLALHQSLAVEVLEEVPPGVSFALTPPTSMGPVGRLVDRGTMEVTLHDSRPPEQRLASREQFVDAMVASQGDDAPPTPWRPSIGWLRLALLIIGMSLIGAALGRVVVAKRKRRVA